jgi:hypothetical protein
MDSETMALAYRVKSLVGFAEKTLMHHTTLWRSRWIRSAVGRLRVRRSRVVGPRISVPLEVYCSHRWTLLLILSSNGVSFDGRSCRPDQRVIVPLRPERRFVRQ